MAPDSTGVQTTSFGSRREERDVEKREKMRLKVHAIVGARTHVVIDARVLDANSADSPQFVPPLQGIFEAGFRPSAALADNGYPSPGSYLATTEMGSETFIPCRSKSIEEGRSSPSWRKAYHLLQTNRRSSTADTTPLECREHIQRHQAEVRRACSVPDLGCPGERDSGEAYLLQPDGRSP